ncbi:MAG: PIN domain-containing protein [Candidatus Hermodarchaeota archaeon]
MIDSETNHHPPDTFFILDTSAIIHFEAVLPKRPGIRYIICSSVLKELKARLTQYRFQALEGKQFITYMDASTEALTKVLATATKVGSLKSLSQTDIDVIALAVHLKDSTKNKVIVITNDFPIQNVCSFLNIAFQSTSKAFKIKEEIEWTWICQYCGQTLEPFQENCLNCGGPPKKVAKRKKQLS